LISLKNSQQVVSPSSASSQARLSANVAADSKSAIEMRSQRATPQDLLKAWDLDLWHMSHSPIKPDLKPLTPEELEALLTMFPDVMPHIYVRPEAILFGIAASEGNLLEVLRRDLVSREVPIYRYLRGGVDVWEWCGGVGGTADVLAFNTLRVKAVHQTLAPLLRLRLE
jgi:hypothetical protein